MSALSEHLRAHAAYLDVLLSRVDPARYLATEPPPVVRAAPPPPASARLATLPHPARRNRSAATPRTALTACTGHVAPRSRARAQASKFAKHKKERELISKESAYKFKQLHVRARGSQETARARQRKRGG